MAPPRSAITAKLQKDQDDLLPSEDEDDEDFTLEDGEGDDGGSDSSDSEREQGPVSKRAKVETVPAEPVSVSRFEWGSTRARAFLIFPVESA